MELPVRSPATFVASLWRRIYTSAFVIWRLSPFPQSGGQPALEAVPTRLLHNPALDHLADAGLLSAQLSIGFDDWTIEAYGSNLANKKYVSGLSGNNEFYGTPREYTVRAWGEVLKSWTGGVRRVWPQ